MVQLRHRSGLKARQLAELTKANGLRDNMTQRNRMEEDKGTINYWDVGPDGMRERVVFKQDM